MARLRTALLLAAAALGPGMALTASAQAPVVMATGLDNPRGIAIGPDGAIYVAEAGRGGASTLCLPPLAGGGERCYGPTGAITRITAPGVQARVIGGLPSVAAAGGAEATGPHELVFAFDRAFLTVGSGADPALLAPFRAAGVNLGMLHQISFTGVVTPLVDISAYEATANPDGGALDSNAYGLDITATRGLVTDAGGNSLLQIAPTLAVTTLAVFPPRDVPGPGGGTVPMQSVPTTVEEGPDGFIYVGELTGFPFPQGGARVYRVPPAGGEPVVVAEGFTNIIDIAIAEDGTSYVLEIDADGLLTPGTPGRLVKIGPFGFRTELAPGALIAPNRLAIDGEFIYVTTNSASAGTGQVVRIPR